MSENKDHDTINVKIAKLLNHDTPLSYTKNIQLAWQSLEALQEQGYGFTLTSLGRESFKVRVIKWAKGDYAITSTGEYIANVIDGPASFAICRAVVEAIEYERYSSRV